LQGLQTSLQGQHYLRSAGFSCRSCNYLLLDFTKLCLELIQVISTAACWLSTWRRRCCCDSAGQLLHLLL
jgi:hypothetical protein